MLRYYLFGDDGGAWCIPLSFFEKKEHASWVLRLPPHYVGARQRGAQALVYKGRVIINAVRFVFHADGQWNFETGMGEETEAANDRAIAQVTREFVVDFRRVREIRNQRALERISLLSDAERKMIALDLLPASNPRHCGIPIISSAL